MQALKLLIFHSSFLFCTVFEVKLWQTFHFLFTFKWTYSVWSNSYSYSYLTLHNLEFIWTPEGEAYRRRFVVQYLVRQITFKLLLGFKWNLVYR